MTREVLSGYLGYRISHSKKEIYVEERVSPLEYHAHIIGKLLKVCPGYKVIEECIIQ